VVLPVLRPTTEEIVEGKRQYDVDTDRTVVAFLIENPDASIMDCAIHIGATKSSAQRRLVRPQKDGIVDFVLGQWTVTPKGRRGPNSKWRKDRDGDPDTTGDTPTL